MYDRFTANCAVLPKCSKSFVLGKSLETGGELSRFALDKKALYIFQVISG